MQEQEEQSILEAEIKKVPQKMEGRKLLFKGLFVERGHQDGDDVTQESDIQDDV